MHVQKIDPHTVKGQNKGHNCGKSKKADFHVDSDRPCLSGAPRSFNFFLKGK